ncbi:molybdopterin-dependent oxidoreductase, partial [Avibacterium paragallinarum]
MKKQDNINASRRDFIKHSSLGLAGTSLSGGVVGSLVSSKAVATEQSTVVTAAHWGPLGVVVEEGKVVKSGPAIPAPLTNELQSVVADQLYSETRVKYPMVRKGYLEGNKDTTLRGRDEWVRVSWEQAFDLVAKEMKRVRDSYGATGIYAGSYGWYSSGSL